MAKWVRSEIDVGIVGYDDKIYRTAGFMCSDCGSEGWYPLDVWAMFFCPNCGAKMDRYKDQDVAILYEKDGKREYHRTYEADGKREYHRTYEAE